MTENERKPWPLSERRKQKLKKEHRVILRMLVQHALYGITLGTLAALALVHFDIGKMGTLLANSDHRIGFTFLLVAGLGSTFGMVAMGIGIMFQSDSLGEED